MIIKEQLDKYKNYLLARSMSLNYYNIMKIFSKYLGDKELNQEEITNFFISHKYSNNSKSQFIRAGRNFNDFLELPKDSCPWHKIKLMKVESKIPDCITEEELDRGISIMITHNGRLMNSTKLKALLHFLFFSAVRKQEVLNLHRIDFDFNNNIAKVLGKFSKERYVYFPKNVSKEIQDFFNSEPEQNNAFNVTLGQLNYMPKILGKCINKKVYMHLFRHSASRNMNDNGIDLPVISQILGHKSVNTTMIYLRPSQKQIQQVYKNRMNYTKEISNEN